VVDAVVGNLIVADDGVKMDRFDVVADLVFRDDPVGLLLFGWFGVDIQPFGVELDDVVCKDDPLPATQYRTYACCTAGAEYTIADDFDIFGAFEQNGRFVVAVEIVFDKIVFPELYVGRKAVLQKAVVLDGVVAGAGKMDISGFAKGVAPDDRVVDIPELDRIAPERYLLRLRGDGVREDRALLCHRKVDAVERIVDFAVFDGDVAQMLSFDRAVKDLFAVSGTADREIFQRDVVAFEHYRGAASAGIENHFCTLFADDFQRLVDDDMPPKQTAAQLDHTAGSGTVDGILKGIGTQGNSREQKQEKRFHDGTINTALSLSR